MGITVHYTIKHTGSQDELISILGNIKDECGKVDLKQVDKHIKVDKITQTHIDIYHWLQKQTDFPNNTKENLKMRDTILDLIGIDTWKMINAQVYHKGLKPTTIISWGVWAGEGCEGTDFMFHLTDEGWVAKSFTKTQYAEDFAKCHLLVCYVLKLFLKYGCQVEVHDEGGWWGVEDIKTLADNINQSTAMIEGLSKQLTKTFVGGKIYTPIDKCKNYMRVKKTR